MARTAQWRESTTWVATLVKSGKFLAAEPFFEPGTRTSLERSSGRRAKPGELVLVRRKGGRAQVIKGLGSSDNARNVVEALLLDRGLQRGFAESVERSAEAAVGGGSEQPRKDLHHLPTITIDPTAAKDFDDAISIERDGDGVRAYVHIADVSAYVGPDSPIEHEARRRGCSVYVPGAVEPMLPGTLSNSACSLVPGEPRMTVTVETEVSAAGSVGKSRFYRSTIRSDRRLTYDEVDRIFAGKDRLPGKLGDLLTLARGTAAALRENRFARGSLAVETTEAEFEFDDQGQVSAASESSQTESQQLIEELMIMANERVAEHLESARKPLLFRIHERPEPAAIDLLVEQLASLDVPTPPVPDRIDPQVAAELAGSISVKVGDYTAKAGRGRQAFTSLILRSLKQAIYSPHNVGHSGLASHSYCHFTSPIRRYPDLVAHRVLLDSIGAEGATYTLAELEEAGWHASATEREATQLEHDADDICLAFLLERELFEGGWERQFEGEVIGVINAGAFIKFEEYEGFLPARRMPGDYFQLNDEGTALIGRRTGSTLRLGDPVDVKVDRVERARGRVDLVPAAQG